MHNRLEYSSGPACDVTLMYTIVQDKNITRTQATLKEPEK